jgi:hypothetical protein
LLYEPDGVLHAVAVGTTMTVAVMHRERRVLKADMLVVPQAVALEFEPILDMLAIRCDGTPPDHFRERFIQVWGYDYLPAAMEAGSPATERFHEVIAESDSRFHLGYAIWEIPDSPEPSLTRFTGHDVVILLSLDGSIDVELAERGMGGTNVELPGGHLLGLASFLDFRLRGSGRVALLRLKSEIVFQASRALLREEGRANQSPEFTSFRHNRPDRDSPPENQS